MKTSISIFQQKASVLPISLVLLSVISITTIYSMKSNLLEAKVIRNIQQYEDAFHNAYGGLELSYSKLANSTPTPEDIAVLVSLIKNSTISYDDSGMVITSTPAEYLADSSKAINQKVTANYTGRKIPNSTFEYHYFALNSESSWDNSAISSTQELTFSRLAKKQKNKID